MFWSDETHSYQATTCPRIGRPCPHAACLIAHLAQSVAKSRPFTEEDFEITGFGPLKGCGASCSAQFVARHDRVRMFCGVAEDAERAPLEAMADAMFDQGGHGRALSLPAFSARPLALIEGRPAT